ncbi:MAG: beta-N-acetylhexosaminidase [Spirochaetes bacterium]|nr:beta-N-acetylhexosaminidase [Spirochaetota bacterium]MBU1080085.1 beta-N-acetylhexosaminidase [Spirochaetota bacterium]
MSSSGILPKPLSERLGDGRLEWLPGASPAAVGYEGECRGVAERAASFLSAATGAPWSVSGDPSVPAFVRFRVGAPAGLGSAGGRSGPGDGSVPGAGSEAYSLDVGPAGVACRSAGIAGLLYAFQGLRQLLPAAAEKAGGLGSGFSLPFAAIADRPRFVWRGFMLDEARHFFGTRAVKDILDLMALLKLNVLHWHLNDDQGWRVEIDRYPELTRVGSNRADTAVGGFGSRATAGEPYGGFYTKAEVREVVAYASSLCIAVVPEFEMPGHSSAALASYPELGCTGGPYAVETGQGIFPDIYCAGKESTFDFIEGVLDELLELFPSEYFHIGGDEAPPTRWRSCPACRSRMRAEGLSSEAELGTWFLNRAAARLASRGRRAVVWNDIMGDGLRPDAVGQYWLGDKRRFVSHMRRGRPAIMSDFWRAYLDYDYHLHPLRKAYAYEPVPPGFGDADVLGIEAALWTEWVRDRDRLDRQAFPRLVAHAETAWSAADARAYGDFERRLVDFLPRLDALGVGYAPRSEWNPAFFPRLANNAALFLNIFRSTLRRRK